MAFLPARALTAAQAPADPRAIPHRYSFYVFGGTYDFDEEIGILSDASSERILGLGLAHRFNRRFEQQFEFWEAGARFDSLPALGLEEDLILSIGAFVYALRGTFPIGRFQPYIAGGIGLSKAMVSEHEETNLYLGLEELEDDRGPVWQAALGAEILIGKKSRIGIELRSIDVEVDLGEFTGGEVDPGGVTTMLLYRFDFGRALGTSSDQPAAAGP